MDTQNLSRALKAYLALCKPQIALMVILTSALGYFLAGGQAGAVLWWTMLGTGLSASACGCLNQFLERGPDSLMKRTQGRPLPSGRLKPANAFVFGTSLAVCGLAALYLKVGLLPCVIAAATIVLYLFIYTPLKLVTPQTTWAGAAAGATPPLIGWAAAQGHLGAKAWILFGIQFLWQIPHFLSIFWNYRADYAKAGFRVMPVVDPDGGLTAIQIAIHSFTLLLASMLPVIFGMAGLGYAFAALILSGAFLGLGMRASWTMETVDTRRLFFASLAYLPILFGMLLLA
jgi:protoheme IX farnesyltransferase